MNNKIQAVEPGSIAEELGLQPGDEIVSCNGHKIEDELDLRFYFCGEVIELEVITGGEREIIEIENPYGEELGVIFESALFGGAKHCANKCIFCFIDQLPRGMRESLYFKDDDSRLSFLTGNYVTLTNAKDSDLDKIIRMHMEPINVSVHTTNPCLRKFMLKNPKAERIMEQMRRLASGHIHMNCQIVLVKGVNDGAEFYKTVSDLASLYPYVTSVSAVPMGITKFRENLYCAQPFEKEDSKTVLNDILKMQKDCLNKLGTRFIYGADEFYLSAGYPIPAEEEYEGYHQIENGVGLIRSMHDEFSDALNSAPKGSAAADIITGMAAGDEIKKLANMAKTRYNNMDIAVHTVRNDFFGERITVAGLITGGDIIKQLKGKIKSRRVLIPSVMLRHGTETFLDDTTVTNVREALGADIIVTDCSGYDLWDKIKGD
ncbi:MAG: DUF512 domain-containing protein [Clostridia bacterium]|nr:DUF512 domain-containing protein [Clostridia bacterium]